MDNRQVVSLNDKFKYPDLIYSDIEIMGQSFGGQHKQVFAKAPSLSTAEIKMIVDGLNRPPFMSNLSLVEFDDKAPLELLELLNRVLGNLDNTHLSVDI